MGAQVIGSRAVEFDSARFASFLYIEIVHEWYTTFRKKEIDFVSCGAVIEDLLHEANA